LCLQQVANVSTTFNETLAEIIAQFFLQFTKTFFIAFYCTLLTGWNDFQLI